MKRLSILLLITMLLLNVLSGCSRAELDKTVDEGNEYKEEIIVGCKVNISTLNPQEIANVGHGIHYKLTHETLVYYDMEKGEVQPKLAKDWKISNNGKTYTFSLRDDVFFHNGEKMTADDIIFTIDYAKEAGSSEVPLYNLIEEKKALDDYTLEITLKNVNMDFLIGLGTVPSYGILNRKAVEKDPVKGPIIGTGPWVNKEFVPGDYILDERFEDYWGEKPVTKKMRFRYIPEDTARLIALETGEIDFCIYPNSTEWQYIEDNKDLTLHKYYASNLNNLVFNTKKEIMNDQNFRLAIAYALDIEEILEGAYGGLGIKSNSLWNPQQYGYFDDWASVGRIPYFNNMDKAKEHLAKSKYPNGAEFTIAVNNKERLLVAQIIQAQLEPLGISVNIEEFDSAGFTAMANDYKHMALINSIGLTPAGDDIRRLVSPTARSSNRAAYDNARVNELLELAVAEENDAKRREYYKEIQIIIHDECPYIPMFHNAAAMAYHKNVSGAVYDNRGYWELAYLKRTLD